MIFELVRDFAEVLSAMPAEHTRFRLLKLLDEAIRRDVHFIFRHRKDYPQALFQSLWNHGWWYDCPDAAMHYQLPEGGWREPPPWEHPGPKLYELLQHWYEQKIAIEPDFAWVRARRPPATAIGLGQMAILRGHTDFIKSVAFFSDNRRVVSGSSDNTVIVWDVQSGEHLAILQGHNDAIECLDTIQCVACSPDGRRIVSGSMDKTVRIWDVQIGSQLSVLRGHESCVDSVAYSPNGLRIVSGSSDKTIRIWDMQTGAGLAVLRGHERGVTSVSYSPDGRRIVSGSFDNTVRIWDAETGAGGAVLRHESAVRSVAYSPDGTRIVSGSFDKTIRL